MFDAKAVLASSTILHEKNAPQHSEVLKTLSDVKQKRKKYVTALETVSLSLWLYLQWYICVYIHVSEVTQSSPTLWDPMDFSLPGSSVHGIF